MPEHQPYVPATQSPAELTPRALLLGVLLGLIFSASSVYLALKIGLTVSSSIPIAVLSITIFRALGRTSILENNIVQTTGSASDSVAAGVVFTIPAILLMGYDLDISRVAVLATAGGLMGILMMIPLRRALIVKEHDTLIYPEGTACAEVLIAGEERGLQAKRVFQAFGVGFVYKFLMGGLKLWPDVPGKALAFYPGAAISSEISPELLGVGYIIGPRIAGYLFAGGCFAYLVLAPAIKLVGSGLTEPFGFPAVKLIRDMSPGELRSSFVFYIGAGAVASAGIIALARSLPTIMSSFASSWKELRASRLGQAVTRLRTEDDLPRRGRRHGECRQHVAGPEDRFPRRLHAAKPADRHPDRRPGVGARGRLDPHAAQPGVHLSRPRDTRPVPRASARAHGGWPGAGRGPARDHGGVSHRRQRLGGPRHVSGGPRVRRHRRRRGRQVPDGSQESRAALRARSRDRRPRARVSRQGHSPARFAQGDDHGAHHRRHPDPQAAVGVGPAGSVHHHRDRAHGGAGAAGRGGGLPADLHLVGDVRGRRGPVADRAAGSGAAAIARPGRVGTGSAVRERPDRRRSHLWDRAGGGRGGPGLRGRARRAGARVQRARERDQFQRPGLRALRTAWSAALLGGPARAVTGPRTVGAQHAAPLHFGMRALRG